MVAKRVFDLIFVVPGLVLLFPFFMLVSLLIKLDSKGPVLFKQTRVGMGGKSFQVLKLRTMVVDVEQQGDKITIGGDPRITKAGIFLRKYKLDELPQLFNVLIGEMSLVGPRPEVPEYVAFYPEKMKKIVLSVPPGITDRASIEYKDENEILANSNDPIKDYREKILPIKLDYYKKYVQKRSLWIDFILIFSTFYSIGKRKNYDRDPMFQIGSYTEKHMKEAVAKDKVIQKKPESEIENSTPQSATLAGDSERTKPVKPL